MSAPIASLDGEYVYKGTTKMGGPIANISVGRMSAAGSGGAFAVDVECGPMLSQPVG